MEPKYDSVVSSVVKSFQQRALVGQVKYGKTLDRNDLTFLQWIQHAQEEMMDGILYLEKMKQVMSISDNPLSSSKQDHAFRT